VPSRNRLAGRALLEVRNPQTYALRVGTITQRTAFSPQRQIWRRSALDWVDALAAVPATERGGQV